MDLQKMGYFIFKLRKEKGLTQEQLGNLLSEEALISNKTISKWERGVSAPDIFLLPKLSEVLGVSIDELLNGEKDNIKVNSNND